MDHEVGTWKIACFHVQLKQSICNGFYIWMFDKMCFPSISLRANLHHLPWSWNMEGGMFSWSNLMVQISWSDPLKKSIYKAFGPLTRCNSMWTKRNDQASKGECVGFLNISPKLAIFRKPNQVWPFSCLHLILSQKKFCHFLTITTFLCHGPLPFSTRAPLLPLPPRNPLDHVSG